MYTDALEYAQKAAVTDARKRCLKLFGQRLCPDQTKGNVKGSEQCSAPNSNSDSPSTSPMNKRQKGDKSKVHTNYVPLQTVTVPNSNSNNAAGSMRPLRYPNLLGKGTEFNPHHVQEVGGASLGDVISFTQEGEMEGEMVLALERAEAGR